MSVYFVTGFLGSGKGLAAVSRLRDYAARGNPIAGNIDINLEHFADSPYSKQSYIRVPDHPTAHDLEMLGDGNPDSYDEYKNGLLVLDELATWFNARKWQDKGREALIEWFVHSRKHGWDVIFLVQSIEVVDKQLIESLMEYHAPVSNLAKINVPIVGRLWRHFSPTNRPLTLPKFHTVNVMYKNIVNADRWTFSGRNLYKMYDTKQTFSASWPHSSYCMLSNWHTVGHTLPPQFKIDTRFILLFIPRFILWASVRLFAPRYLSTLMAR